MRTALLKRQLLNTGSLVISYVKLFPWLFRLNKNSIVLDCGANVGRITSYLSLTGAKIYAFEPDPIAFKILTNRCKHKENITCINKGVWDKNAIIQLYRHHEMKKSEPAFTVGSSIIVDKKNVDSTLSFDVEVIDLLSFIHGLNQKIDLIKMDVEGAEIEILKRIINVDQNKC